ncbi:MAG: N-acetylglucosamine-6-phosphate deacetylase [Planctomycetota bacterium]
MQFDPGTVSLGPVRVLRAANIVLPDRVVVADLELEGTQIRALVPSGAGKGDECWDLGGYRVAPGFIDLHTHGGWGIDFFRDGRARAIEAATHYGRAGVTRLLLTLYSAPVDEMLERLSEAARTCAEEPAFLGIHLEGPFISADKKGALPPAGIFAYDDKLLARILAASAGQLRVMTFAPEALPIGAITRLRAAGVLPSIGHTACDSAATRAAIIAGAWRATHLCNAMPALHHRRPGPLAPLLLEERVRVEVIADGQHVDDEMLRLIIKTKGAERVMVVSDSMPLAGLPPTRATFAGMEVTTNGVRATLPDGTLAGSTMPMGAALLRMERVLGYTPSQICQLGSIAPADDLRLPRTGRVASAHRADLVISAPDGSIVATLRAGCRVGALAEDAFLPPPIARVD